MRKDNTDGSILRQMANALAQALKGISVRLIAWPMQKSTATKPSIVIEVKKAKRPTQGAFLLQQTGEEEMETLIVKSTGVSPLLMNSDIFTNPLDPRTKAHKELTSKRKKTDEDHVLIARSSWMGACYYDETVGFYVPGIAIERCLHEAAKLQKMGKQVQRGLIVSEDMVPIEHPRKGATPDELWEDLEYRDCRSVRVGTSKVMRYRPVFREWSICFTVLYSAEMLSEPDIRKFVEDSGAFIGLLDFRPRFGRFDSTVHTVAQVEKPKSKKANGVAAHV